MERAFISTSNEHENNSMQVQPGLISKTNIWLNKFLLIIFFLLVAGLYSGYGQYPIPSYKVTITGKATFQEKQHSGDITLERRRMIITSTCLTSSAGSCTATVWVYSLDGCDILGPFKLDGGDTLYVDIDEREWSVLIVSDYPIIVDVWIE